MAKYYQDFVGLNTFIYEPVGFDPGNQTTAMKGVASEKATDQLPAIHFFVEQNLFGGGIYGLGETQSWNLSHAKNHAFPHQLSNTASFFSALMLHRNGPYGFPMWKQTRAGQNPLTRKQTKSNIFTHIEEPGKEAKIDNRIRRARYGEIKAYNESPVISRFKPVSVQGSSLVVSPRTGQQTIQRFGVDVSLGNTLASFDNEALDKYYNLIDRAEDTYDDIKELYLDDGLDAPDSPFDVFETIKYSEVIFPTQLYSNRHYTRQRTNYSFPWNGDRAKRTRENPEGFHDGLRIDNGFGTFVKNQSMWPLDPPTSWKGIPRPREVGKRYWSLYATNNYTLAGTWGYGDSGILMNNYSHFLGDLRSHLTGGTMNNHLVPGPIYARRHMLEDSASVVSQNGMQIEGITYGQSFNHIDNSKAFAAGEAWWDAGAQSGKTPFYDSYTEFIQGVRQRGQGYSILPEFKISNHISSMKVSGYNHKFADMFDLPGAKTDLSGSDAADFFKVYSTSEFLKHFDIVKEDHKEFAEPVAIKLKCKAIKKFLPYDGFYPAQRTAELAKQFYKSYNKNVIVASGSNYDWAPLAESGSTKIAYQNLLTPLFGPGILFNSIKAGVACDYPIFSGSHGIDNPGALPGGLASGISFGDIPAGYCTQEPNMMLNNIAPTYYLRWDERIPFKALVEPERHLSQKILSCNEPSKYAYHSSSCIWDGNGDDLYKMMAHNFLAEVPNFFLPGGQFRALYSKPSRRPDVGQAEAGRTYTMRVKMFKTSDNPNEQIGLDNSGALMSSSVRGFFAPQYPSSSIENFTMYSRPSAFGPPYHFDQSKQTYIFGPPPAFLPSFTTLRHQFHNPNKGENYCFTPPYYYGQAWADIKFVATETKKYSIDEIVRKSEVTYMRYLSLSSSIAEKSDLFKTSSFSGYENLVYNSHAMQLSGTMNLFALGAVKNVDVEDDDTGRSVKLAIDVSAESENKRWIMQPYFETPMANFNHYSASNSITMPTNGSESVPRGMWHQYGKLETDPSKGIFMQITDVPFDFRIKISGSHNDRSLKDLVGFSSDPIKLGQPATSKVISEAVVAIPFVQEGNEKKFFKIERETIDFLKRTAKLSRGGTLDDMFVGFASEDIDVTSVGKSIRDMFIRMKKYVIPPSFDFVHREDIDPFAMYIFEFKHTLDQQDLSDIWQNLPPTIATSFEEAEATIDHHLLSHHLLSGGEQIQEGQKKRGNPLPDKIKWMIFKVKRRAEANYYNKIVDERRGAANSAFASIASNLLRPEGYSTDLSYNWPYDFFSLVELVKLDAEVTLADSESFKEDTEKPVVKRGGNILRAHQNLRAPVMTPEQLARSPEMLRMAAGVSQNITTTAGNIQQQVANALGPSGFFGGGGDDE